MMLIRDPVFKLYTGNYRHEYSFCFGGKNYLIHSIVKLTNEGKKYFNSQTDEVILIEHFIDWKGREQWKYEFRSNDVIRGHTDASTLIPPDQLILEIVMPATITYITQVILNVPDNTRTIKTKDWEVSEVRTGWMIFIIIFFVVMIFKDPIIRWLIRGLAGWIFGLYRQAYMSAYTAYDLSEHKEMLKKKHEILYEPVKRKGV